MMSRGRLGIWDTTSYPVTIAGTLQSLIMRRVILPAVALIVSGCVFTELTEVDGTRSNNANNENNINNVNNVNNVNNEVVRDPIVVSNVTCSDIPLVPTRSSDPEFAVTENTRVGTGIPFSGDGFFTPVGFAEVRGSILYVTVGEWLINGTDLEFDHRSWSQRVEPIADEDVVYVLPSIERRCPVGQPNCDEATEGVLTYNALILTETSVLSCNYLAADGTGTCSQEPDISGELAEQGVYPPRSIEYGVAPPVFQGQITLDGLGFLGAQLVIHAVGGDPTTFSTISFSLLTPNNITRRSTSGVSVELPDQYETGLFWGITEESRGFPYLAITADGDDGTEPVVLALNEGGQYVPIEGQAWSIPDDVSLDEGQFTFVQQLIMSGNNLTFNAATSESDFGYIAARDDGDAVVFARMARDGVERDQFVWEVDGGVVSVVGARSIGAAQLGTLDAPFVVRHGDDGNKISVGLWGGDDAAEIAEDILQSVQVEAIYDVQVSEFTNKFGSIHMLGNNGSEDGIFTLLVDTEGGLDSICSEN